MQELIALVGRGVLAYGAVSMEGKMMTPQLSAGLHAQGLLMTAEALWVYGDQGRIVANKLAMIKDGEPVF